MSRADIKLLAEHMHKTAGDFARFRAELRERHEKARDSSLNMAIGAVAGAMAGMVLLEPVLTAGFDVAALVAIGRVVYQKYASSEQFRRLAEDRLVTLTEAVPPAGERPSTGD